MNTSNWGGSRKGSGRKPTGKKIVNLTLTLKNQAQADLLKKRAADCGLTVSQLVIKFFRLDESEN